MKRLLLDVGNTCLKWAVAVDRKIEASNTVTHLGDPAGALEMTGWPPVESIWISSVTGPEIAQRIRQRLESIYPCPLHFAVSERQRMGLRCVYAEPRRLGVDRWLAMLGAWTSFGGPLSVADAGTALTVDRVDDTGHHLGGLIAPGLMTMQHAVLGATRFGSQDSTREGDSHYHDGLGQNTDDAVRQGAFLACLGVIERAIRPRFSITSTEIRLITGGSAAALLPYLDASWQFRPHLVLEGLLALAIDEEAKPEQRAAH